MAIPIVIAGLSLAARFAAVYFARVAATRLAQMAATRAAVVIAQYSEREIAKRCTQYALETVAIRIESEVLQRGSTLIQQNVNLTTVQRNRLALATAAVTADGVIEIERLSTQIITMEAREMGNHIRSAMRHEHGRKLPPQTVGKNTIRVWNGKQLVTVRKHAIAYVESAHA